MLNIHPALLPAFAGLHAQKQALDFGAKVAGCSVHFVVPEVDAGPIVIQRAVPVMEDAIEETPVGPHTPGGAQDIPGGGEALRGGQASGRGATGEGVGVMHGHPDGRQGAGRRGQGGAKGARLGADAARSRATLATILVGTTPPSRTYVALKHRAAAEMGIKSENHVLDEGRRDSSVRELIRSLNGGRRSSGMILQLPAPGHLEPQPLIEEISVEKDVDGLTSATWGCSSTAERRWSRAPPRGS